MNTANNVTPIGGDFDCTANTTTDATTNTITISGGTGDYWWYQPRTTGDYWYPSYALSPIINNDEVAELKAWLDGFMVNRKMTEKNLKIIKERLDDFIES